MKLLPLIILFVMFLVPPPAHADTLSCDGGVISDGDSAVDLIMKCGQPAWKESHQEESVDTLDRNFKRKIFINVEEWTYNFGPQQFMRIVTLRNGVISSIRSGQYGTGKEETSPGSACGDRVISAGDTKTDILIKCGEPIYKETHQEEVKERIDGSGSRSVTVNVEEWTYNFGPQRFTRIITFRNGLVVDIRTGTYGR